MVEKTTKPVEASEAPKLPFTPKVVKAVTREVLKLVELQPAYVKILVAIYTGKELKGTDKKADMKPAQITDVINLVNNQEMQLICGAIVESSLIENYPDAGYVNKCFSITKQPKREGKRYFTYDISEIEDPTKK